jgi:hypothetical protein
MSSDVMIWVLSYITIDSGIEITLDYYSNNLTDNNIGVYGVSSSDGFMWHIIHTEIREDWFMHTSNITVLRYKFEKCTVGITDRRDL